MRNLGWLRDPHKRPGETQDQDAAATLKAVTVPQSASLESSVQIIDQGHLGSCVWNAIAQAVRISHVKAGVSQPKLLSRLFGYYFSRAYHHQTNEDSGTFIRYGFSVLNKFGFCPEELWTYSDGPDKFRKMPGWQAIQGAYDQRSPTTYQRIYDDGDARLLAIKQAIAAGYAVVFGTDVSVDFCNGTLASDGEKPPIGKSIAGGHAMCVVGYNGNLFRVANSWGSDFGDRGFVNFTGDYLKWANTNDLWIVQHSPKYSG
jgi:C1A family cysteine protease